MRNVLLSLLTFLLCIVAVSLHAQLVVLSEDFESGNFPADWSQFSNATDGGFQVGNAASLSSQFFPIGVHTTFIATNDDNCNCNKSNETLHLPRQDFSGAVGPIIISFDYYAVESPDPTYTDSAYLEWSTDSVSWTPHLIPDDNSGWVDNYQVVLTGLENQATAYIRFRYSDFNNWSFGLALDNITLFQPSANDLALVNAWPNNAQTCLFADSVQVKVKYTNVGSATQSQYILSYTLGVPGGGMISGSEGVNVPINFEDTLTHTFSNFVDVSTLGAYSLAVKLDLPNDADTTDNVLNQDFEHATGALVLAGGPPPFADQTWEVYDEQDQLVATGGPWEIGKPFNEVICLSDSNCYRLKVYDGVFNEGWIGAIENFSISYNGQVIFMPPIDAVNFPAPGHADFEVFSIGGACPAIDMELVSLALPNITGIDTQTVAGTVFSRGTDSVMSFDLRYKLDNGPPKITSFTGLNLSTGSSFEFIHNDKLMFTQADIGAHVLEVSVENINGGATDATPGNNTQTLNLHVVENPPQKWVVIEEATGTWCQWCPRGAVFLDSLLRTRSFAIGVAVHNQDPMAISDWDGFINNEVSGYPSGLADREEELDPLDFLAVYDRRVQLVPEVRVGLQADYDPPNRLISGLVTAEFVIPSSEDLRLNLWIVEDSVTGSGTGYDQANNYAGGQFGPMQGFENLPDPVPAAQMIYRQVGRHLLHGPEGAVGSLPPNLKADTVYSLPFAYVLPSQFDESQVSIVGLVQRPGGSIENAIIVQPEFPSVSVDELSALERFQIFPNPADAQIAIGLDLRRPEHLKISLYNALGQLIHAQSQRFSAGSHRLMISSEHLPDGMYQLLLESAQGRMSGKVQVRH